MFENKDNKKRLINTYLVFLFNGMLALSIGSLMPFIRDERGLDYAFAGLLVSIHSVGNFVSSFIAGYLPIYLGRKKSILVFNSFYTISFLLILFTGNKAILFAAFFLTGITRGATSNFCNLEINDLSPGKAWLLNVLHACFAVGALVFPLIVIALTKNNTANWMYACAMLVICGVISFILYFMTPANESLVKKKDKDGKSQISYGFFKEKIFYLTVFTLFFYLCCEQGVIGWMITYFKDTGLLDAGLSQATASIHWSMILIGRLLAAYLSTKFPKQKLLIIMGCGMTLSFLVLISAQTTLPIMLGIMGFGLFMAGVYPTTVSFSGLLMEKYPFSWSWVLTFASFGAILMPSIIGTIAQKVSITAGMASIAVALIIDMVFIIMLNRYINKEAK